MRTFEACGVGALQLVDRADVARPLRAGRGARSSSPRRTRRPSSPAVRHADRRGRRAMRAAGRAPDPGRAHLRPPGPGPGGAVDGLIHPARPRGLAPLARTRGTRSAASEAHGRVLRDIARPDAPRRAGRRDPRRPDPARARVPRVEARTSSALALLRRLARPAPRRMSSSSRPSPCATHLPPWTWQESGGSRSRSLPELADRRRGRAVDRALPRGRPHRPRGARGRRPPTSRASSPCSTACSPRTRHRSPPARPCSPGARPTPTFWRSGRDDVETTVVGSQLLWDAADPAARRARPRTRDRSTSASCTAPSSPRELLAAAAEAFCRAEHDATYRPHPTERDRALAGDRTHGGGRQGIRVDRSGVPLRELGAPVVSVFSTGVLEAAAARAAGVGRTAPTRPHGCGSSGTVTTCAPGAAPRPPRPERPRPRAVARASPGSLQGMMAS